MAGDVEHVQVPGQGRADRHHPAGGQHAEEDGEQHDQHQAQPELRRRVGEQRDDGDDAVEPLAVAHGGDGAEQHAEQRGDDDRREHQEHGRRDALQDEVEHRPLLDVGEAEVEGEQLAEIDEELLVEGTVEAEGAAQLVDIALVAATGLGGDDIRRVARGEMEEREVEDGDAEHAGDDLGGPPRH